jgi:hypothetical protein
VTPNARAASTAPFTISWGAKSPPMASTAILMRLCAGFLLLFLLYDELAIVVSTVHADVMGADQLVAVCATDKTAEIADKGKLDFAVSVALPAVGYLLLRVSHSTFLLSRITELQY